ncbi:MAG: flavodoxin family protein [Bacteroidota bacterium]|nr:flavodoxin family protein [Bacteroidota bacterium]
MNYNPQLNQIQQEWVKTSKWEFSDLKALYLNCTLKRSPEKSHTEGLISLSAKIMKENKVKVEVLRPVDYDIPPGVYPDMSEKGWGKDEWPMLFEKVMKADILIIGSPIWLGDKSSVCTKVIERLYGQSAELNEKGQFTYYGKTGGCIITGNEDGIKHCGMNILYSLQHLGYVVPPQADSGWVGEAGPGPSYLDEKAHGPENDFTNRNTTFMAWNLMHFARMLKDNGGIPAHGNQRKVWEAGCNAENENPEHR